MKQQPQQLLPQLSDTRREARNAKLGRALVIAVLAIVVVVLLFVVWAFNRVERVDDANEMMRILRKMWPNVSAFTVAYDAVQGRATNVTVDQNGRALIRENERTPVTSDGERFRLEAHGKIVYDKDGNGYTVTGITSVSFRCPKGHTGHDCRPVPLCSAGDAGKLKPLTYSQFNALRLYDASTLGSEITSALARNNKRKRRQADGGGDDSELLYPRIRVRCLDASGRFRLESCPRNELLDERLVCRPYDVCSDSVDGFRHNYPIGGGEKLQPNEYYVCRDDRSVRTKCTDEQSIWVDRDKMCEVANACTNQDNGTTLPIDGVANAYLVCEHGQPRRVDCEYGVRVTADGRRVCRRRTCVPRVERYTDKHLDYATNAVLCGGVDDETPIPVQCTTQQTGLRVPFAWQSDRDTTRFEIVVPNWPNSVFDEKTNKCRAVEQTADDPLLRDPVVEFRYTDLMRRPFPFDLRKRSYVCGPKQWRWDYAGSGQLVPAVAGRFYDDYFAETANPCHDSVLPGHSAPWYPIAVAKYLGQPPFCVFTRTDLPIDDEKWWPNLRDHGSLTTSNVGGLSTDDQSTQKRRTFWPFVLLPRDANGRVVRPKPSDIEIYAPRVKYDVENRLVLVTVERSRGVGPIGYRYNPESAVVGDVYDARLELVTYGLPDTAYLDDFVAFTIGSGSFAQPVMPPGTETVYEKSYPWPVEPVIDDFVDQQTIEYGIVWPLVSVDDVNVFANVYISKKVGVYAEITQDDGTVTRNVLDTPLYGRLRLTRQDPGPDPDNPTLVGDALVALVGFNVVVAYGVGTTTVTGQRLPIQLNIP